MDKNQRKKLVEIKRLFEDNFSAGTGFSGNV